MKYGVVEDIQDPLKSGRVRVRIFGLHTDDKSLIPTNKLPWAMCVQPIQSASTSGIGMSPTGIVQGSWVALDFIDADEQYPIVVGTIHGFPEKEDKGSAVEELTLAVNTLDGDSVLRDSQGEPVMSGASETLPAMNSGARRASDFKQIGERGIILIKGQEGYRSNAYQDSGGIWTIGYGTTFYPDGRAVAQGDTITRDRAAEIFAADVNTKFLPIVHRIVNVPVTQEMVDALTSLVYNLGSLKKSSNLITDLNSGKYELAASRFMDYNKARVNGVLVPLPGLTSRREREKNLFLAGGIPAEVGGIDEFPLDPSTVPGPPRDTVDAPTDSTQGERGFTDPSGKYPIFYNEPDVNRLARHHQIVDTVVYRKEISRDKDVVIAGTDGKKKWSQSPIPYNAKYPYNKVTATESGHLMEFDDTENSRRIHLYHAAGTFIEIDDNGTKVTRVVGDGYEILERNGFIHVKGAMHVAVDGAHTLKVSGSANIDISGKTTINVFNDVDLNVSGNLNAQVAGSMTQHVKGSISIRADGNFSVDAERIDLNSGVSGSLPEPKAKVEPDEVELSELTVITRGTESAMQYETPEENGELESYTNNRLSKGEAVKDDYKEPEEVDSESAAASPAPAQAIDCTLIDSMSDFKSDLELSRHFNLGSFTKNGSRAVIAQNGLTKNQIVCNLHTLAKSLDLVKDMFPHMIISSGFRRPGDAANSSRTSRHYSGQAVDIQLPGFSRKEYREAVKKIATMFPFDQLILEYQGPTTWIHIGVLSRGNRSEIFTMSNHKRIGDMGELVLLA